MYLYDRKLSLFLLKLSSFKRLLISIFAIVIKRIAVHVAIDKNWNFYVWNQSYDRLFRSIQTYLYAINILL